ncbi:aminoglycoside phosphotransferase family protein [Streptomyces sp. N50]|uniref:aminoglycoside phosphotransferase family protein n=1 Tax=Streptomyces sp. N50 TaxID=3081765 RepID=UPI0029623777|nr:aminoglycoside phosphotransferase family protein [Streptomyces sp. N50]WOX12716.1 aminoglycoside phosphotransferase family protein [Streptomyces sp. N50]
MTGATTLPDPVRAWAESVIGPLTCLGDASAAHPSRVWEVTTRPDSGRRFCVKLAASPLAFTRETFAHRHAVSYLGPGRAPRLTATSAQHLALLMTALPGTPLSDLRATGAALETVHRKAGALVAQLHQAGKLTPAAREEAAQALRRTADSAERSVHAAGDQMTPAEREFVLARAAELRTVGRVPLGYIHGHVDEHTLRWSGTREPLALIAFERARFAPVVQDFVPLACGPWAGQPRLRTAFFTGYGRRLIPEEKRALLCLTALHTAGGRAAGAGAVGGGCRMTQLEHHLPERQLTPRRAESTAR